MFRRVFEGGGRRVRIQRGWGEAGVGVWFLTDL